MSELKLSTELGEKINSILEEHDPAARDPGVSSQYLCAIVGFLLGQQDMPEARKEELHKQLSAFMLHVMKDVDASRAEQQRPAAADAFGVWKPGMS